VSAIEMTLSGSIIAPSQSKLPGAENRRHAKEIRSEDRVANPARISPPKWMSASSRLRQAYSGNDKTTSRRLHQNREVRNRHSFLRTQKIQFISEEQTKGAPSETAYQRSQCPSGQWAGPVDRSRNDHEQIPSSKGRSQAWVGG